MKKFIKKSAAALTALSISASLAIPAAAEGFLSSVSEATRSFDNSHGDSINLIYNGQLFDCTGAENIDGRVMLPFRLLLEQMGAKVDYEAPTVTASKDGTTITFLIGDNVIYIDKNGEKSQVVSDIAPIIKNDRTLIPVRFISNALGMQVGWDNDIGTVLVVDKDEYIKDLKENASYIKELTNALKYTYNKTNTKLAFKISINSNGEEKNISANVDVNGRINGGDSSVSGKISIDLSDLVSIEPVSDADFNAVFSNGLLYVKSDIIKHLAFGNSALSDKVTKLIADNMAVDGWIYIDLNKLTDKIFGDNMPEINALYKSLLNGDYLEDLKNKSFEDIVSSLIITDGDATFDSAYSSDVMISAYKLLDKYITVTDNSMSIKLDKAFLEDLLENAYGMTARTVSEALDTVTFNITADSSYDDTSANSDIRIDFGVKLVGEKQFSLSFTLNESGENTDSAEDIEIPKDAVDLTDYLIDKL